MFTVLQNYYLSAPIWRWERRYKYSFDGLGTNLPGTEPPVKRGESKDETWDDIKRHEMSGFILPETSPWSSGGVFIVFSCHGTAAFLHPDTTHRRLNNNSAPAEPRSRSHRRVSLGVWRDFGWNCAEGFYHSCQADILVTWRITRDICILLSERLLERINFWCQ